ncbi:MAG: nucleotidyltransferase family protein, partial [Terriglobales bacterium]
MAPGPDSMSSAVPQKTVPQSEGEFDLLCALASADLTQERIQRIATWDLSSVDWSEFLRLAEHHGVLPLAARHLIDHARGLPLEIQRTLQSTYEANLRRSLWFTAQLARIMEHFQREQLPAIAYKGPVLAQSLYRDLGLRSFSDLDFLISPADFARAKQALSEIGYRPAANFTPAVERLWLRTGYERSFDGAAGENLVELQWALLPYFYGVDFHGNDLRIDDLMARSGRTVVGRCEIPCLSPEDSLLALCLHAAKHLWMRLLWLTDIAETFRTQTIDYSLVFSRARALGVARMLGISFWLVRNVLHSELPQPADDLILTDPGVSKLGLEFAQRLARGA